MYILAVICPGIAGTAEQSCPGYAGTGGKLRDGIAKIEIINFKVPQTPRTAACLTLALYDCNRIVHIDTFLVFVALYFPPGCALLMVYSFGADKSWAEALFASLWPLRRQRGSAMRNRVPPKQSELRSPSRPHSRWGSRSRARR